MSCVCPTKIQLTGSVLVGGTVINPFNAEWIYALNKVHDWKCIETNDGVNFVIHTTIEVGNGVDVTYFRDYGHNFTFDAGHNFVLNPPAYLEVGGNTDWTVQERGQIRDALGITGDKLPAVGGQLQLVDEAIFARIVEGTLTFEEYQRIMFAMLSGTSSGHEVVGPQVYKSEDGLKARATFTTDADGNRLTVIRDGS